MCKACVTDIKVLFTDKGKDEIIYHVPFHQIVAIFQHYLPNIYPQKLFFRKGNETTFARRVHFNVFITKQIIIFSIEKQDQFLEVIRPKVLVRAKTKFTFSPELSRRLQLPGEVEINFAKFNKRFYCYNTLTIMCFRMY